MESLETAALFVDNLLDFSSDIGEDDYDDADKLTTTTTNTTTLSSLNTTQPSEMFIDTDPAPFPALEEELEWLSNEDAFPPIESFDILALKPDSNSSSVNVLKNQSPVSVLGLSNSDFRVPVKARTKKRRRRRSFSDFPIVQNWWHCYENKNFYENKKKSVGGGRGGWRNSSTSSVIRRCLHCQADKTPQWRAGPLGPKTLCNACGVRYKSGRLLPEYRPASSPTFSEELHSNSHRKVLDMRRSKQTDDVYFYPPGPKKVLEATRTPTPTLCSEVSALPRKKDVKLERDIKMERGTVWAENSW